MAEQKQAMGQRQSEFGAIAEQHVANLLQLRGWIILARNFRQIGCELDIVASKQNTLAIVEVKHRRTHKLARMEDLLPLRKRRSLVKGARCFVTSRDNSNLHAYATVRFDLALVVPGADKQNPRLANYWPGVFDESNI